MKKVSLGLCLNIFRDYSFEESLKVAREFGFKTVEPGNIDFSFDQIRIENADEDYINALRQGLDEYSMNIYAFAAHCDMYKESGFERFLKKYDIGKRLGANVIVGKSSPDVKKPEFLDNMQKVRPMLEKDGLQLVLETSGDLDYSYVNASQTIIEMNHPQIKINYDTGNFYFRSQGRIKPCKNLDSSVISNIKYFHLKDIKDMGNKVVYAPIGSGDIDFDAVVEVLNQTDVTHVSLEIPVYLWSSKWETLQIGETPLSMDVIKDAVNKSMEFLLNRYDCFELT